MKYTIAFILSFLCGAAPAWALGADAWNTGFIIDFNEQWLRQDALNRALGQAQGHAGLQQAAARRRPEL